MKGHYYNRDYGSAYEALLQSVLGCCYAEWRTAHNGGTGSISVDCAHIPCDQTKRGPAVRLPCDVYGASVASVATAADGARNKRNSGRPQATSTATRTTTAATRCQYKYERSLVAHLSPEDAPLVANAAKKMFCIYTDYCDGKLKGGRYNLRTGERQRMKSAAE